MNMLPPIHKRRSGRSSHSSLKPVASSPPKRPDSRGVRSVFSQERLVQRQMKVLRQRQPLLTRSDTVAYRYSHFHALSVTMIQDGFHRSFAELLTLIEMQRAARERAGPESLLYYRITIVDEHEKLNELKRNLTKAEAASREGRFVDVYDAQFASARYFLMTGDGWLSDHFFEAALETCGDMPDETMKIAEAHCNIGLVVQRAGDFHKAARLFEYFYELAKDEDWENDDGRPLFRVACGHLTRIYTSIADSFASTDPSKIVSFLLKAYGNVRKSNDTQLECSTSYKLAIAYEGIEDYDHAIYYMKRFYDICALLCDPHGIGLSHEATGRCYMRKGKMNECVRYLRLYLRVADVSGVDSDIGRASVCLGIVYNALGMYQEAAELFTNAFEISRRLDERNNVEMLRVHCGLALGHKMLSNVTRHVDSKLKVCTKRLVDWKDVRDNSMGLPMPDHDGWCIMFDLPQ